MTTQQLTATPLPSHNDIVGLTEALGLHHVRDVVDAGVDTEHVVYRGVKVAWADEEDLGCESGWVIMGECDWTSVETVEDIVRYAADQ